MILSLSGALLVSSMAFPLIVFLGAYLSYWLLIRPAVWQIFRFITPMIPFLVILPTIVAIILRQRAARKRTVQKKQPVLGL